MPPTRTRGNVLVPPTPEEDSSNDRSTNIQPSTSHQSSVTPERQVGGSDDTNDSESDTAVANQLLPTQSQPNTPRKQPQQQPESSPLSSRHSLSPSAAVQEEEGEGDAMEEEEEADPTATLEPPLPAQPPPPPPPRRSARTLREPYIEIPVAFSSRNNKRSVPQSSNPRGDSPAKESSGKKRRIAIDDEDADVDEQEEQEQEGEEAIGNIVELEDTGVEGTREEEEDFGSPSKKTKKPQRTYGGKGRNREKGRKETDDRLSTEEEEEPAVRTSRSKKEKGRKGSKKAVKAAREVVEEDGEEDEDYRPEEEDSVDPDEIVETRAEPSSGKKKKNSQVVEKKSKKTTAKGKGKAKSKADHQGSEAESENGEDATLVRKDEYNGLPKIKNRPMNPNRRRGKTPVFSERVPGIVHQSPEDGQVERSESPVRSTSSGGDPYEDRDRPSNPNRLQSFTHWHTTEGKFVPDLIWLHSNEYSWATGDENNRWIPRTREKVVELIERNGGRVVGPKLRDIEKCHIVVTPFWYIRPECDDIWRRAKSFDTEENTGKIIVDKQWIFDCVEYQEDGLDPGYRCDPREDVYTPPSVAPTKLTQQAAPVPFSNVVKLRTREGEKKLIYRVSEEEEKYWFKLARKVETGPKRARLSRSEMFEKMELKFASRYYRTRGDYSIFYESFKAKMLEIKKMSRPFANTKKKRQELDEMKLFTDDEMEEEEDPFDAEDGGRDRDRQDKAREPARQDELLPNPFVKRESQGQLKREAQEDTERGQEEGSGHEQQSFDQDEMHPEFDGSVKGSQDGEEELPRPDLCQVLSREYSRDLHEIQSVYFYTNASERRTRQVLDLLDQAKKLPKSDNSGKGRLVQDAHAKMFSLQQDNLLLKISGKGTVDEREMVESEGWQRLQGTRYWTDEQLFERLDFLLTDGAPWDPTIEERAGVRETFWYPSASNL